MLYRRFGKTGLRMPVLSFGCMRSMHSWKDEPLIQIPDDSTSLLETIVQKALEKGINHVETAHGYGSSERQLGEVLAKFPRDAYILQTKATPTSDTAQFTAKVLTSMERLQVKKLDLLALHGINDHRSLWYSCRKNGCLSAARRLQDKGLVDHIGFSGHGPCDVILSALGHDQDGGFDYFNVHWYYIFDANRKAIEFAADRDIGTFIISPTDKGGSLHTPSAALVDHCAPLSPMLFNDLYCLSNPGVHTISVGASTPEHFDEHLKAIPYLEKSDTAIVSEIDQRLKSAMQRKTGYERPDVSWNLLPDWEQAPGNINLRLITWLFNLYRGWGLEKYARDRYAKLAAGSSWVPGNNGSAAASTDFSPLAEIDGLDHEALKATILKAHQLLSKRL